MLTKKNRLNTFCLGCWYARPLPVFPCCFANLFICLLPQYVVPPWPPAVGSMVDNTGCLKVNITDWAIIAGMVRLIIS